MRALLPFNTIGMLDAAVPAMAQTGSIAGRLADADGAPFAQSLRLMAEISADLKW